MQYDNTKESAILLHVKELSEQGKNSEALTYITKSGVKSPIMENAKGVCLLRLGRYEDAISALREIVFHGDLCIPPCTPVLFQINFASAMLLANKKYGAFSILEKLDEKTYPQTIRLKKAIREWSKNLSLWDKICYFTGAFPEKPVQIDFVPGDF